MRNACSTPQLQHVQFSKLAHIRQIRLGLREVETNNALHRKTLPPLRCGKFFSELEALAAHTARFALRLQLSLILLTVAQWGAVLKYCAWPMAVAPSSLGTVAVERQVFRGRAHNSSLGPVALAGAMRCLCMSVVAQHA